MNAKLKELCSAALALVIGTGAVTLIHLNGLEETISYANWGEEAPIMVEGAFVECIMTHNTIVAARGAC